MKIVQVVLLILVCHPASAMKLALWRDNNYLSINLDEETDTQDSFEYRICPEIWVLIGKTLKLDDIARLSSVSHYFHTDICPICFQSYIGDVLKQQSEQSSQLQARSLFMGFLLARELAKITQSTKKLCEISTNEQKVKDIMAYCQQYYIHDLLRKAETKKLSPLFILQNGRENFDYFKDAYEFESEDKYCVQFGHLFTDPIFLAVGHSCIVFLLIVPGTCIILSNYYSQYNSLQDGILKNATIKYYPGNFNACNNFETEFFGSCTQYNNASCYCEAIYRACETLIKGNVSSWLNWILNNKESNYSFISNYISNLDPNNFEISLPTYNCSTLNNHGMLTCASGNFDHVSVYDLNLDCYIKKTIGTVWEQTNLLKYLMPVGIISCITFLIHFSAYFW
jgi:hypothetical protein